MSDKRHFDNAVSTRDTAKYISKNILTILQNRVNNMKEKVVTTVHYVSEDGEEFANKQLCLAHEQMYIKAKSIVDKLIPTSDTEDFENGLTFVQHDIEQVYKVRNEFLYFIKEHYTDFKWIQETIDNPETMHLSWADRIIAEAAPNSIYQLWGRFTCINKLGREWYKPYPQDNVNLTEEGLPPKNCRQRIKAEGLPYPRSSCTICGAFSPNWKECNSVLEKAGFKID